MRTLKLTLKKKWFDMILSKKKRGIGNPEWGGAETGKEYFILKLGEIIEKHNC